MFTNGSRGAPGHNILSEKRKKAHDILSATDGSKAPLLGIDTSCPRCWAVGWLHIMRRGLHSPQRRRKILHQLKQMNCSIAYLQETHLSDAEHKKLNKSWASQVFYSSHKSGRRRGVATLTHRSVQFCIDSSFQDKEGRYVLINGTINGVWVSMLNVCAPNDNSPQFMKNIFDLVLDKVQGMLLAGGDFHCVLNPFPLLVYRD